MNYSVLSGPPDIEKGIEQNPIHTYQNSTNINQTPIQAKVASLASQYNREDSFNAFQDKNVRKDFIKKIYGILTCQLLFTFFVGLILNTVDGARDFAMSD